MFNFITNKIILLVMFFLSAIILAAAYYIEYFMGYEPCILCIYQRYPYFIIIFLSAIGLMINNFSKYGVLLVIIAITANICISGYHTGIENKIFEPSKKCNSFVKIDDGLSLTEVKKLLYNKGIASCIKPAVVIFKLSMTEWNLLLNVFLSALIFIILINRIKYA